MATASRRTAGPSAAPVRTAPCGRPLRPCARVRQCSCVCVAVVLKGCRRRRLIGVMRMRVHRRRDNPCRRCTCAGSCSASCGGGVRQGLVYECINADVRCLLHATKHAPVQPSVVALSHNMAPYVATNNVPYVATRVCTARSEAYPRRYCRVLREAWTRAAGAAHTAVSCRQHGTGRSAHGVLLAAVCAAAAGAVRRVGTAGLCPLQRAAVCA